MGLHEGDPDQKGSGPARLPQTPAVLRYLRVATRKLWLIYLFLYFSIDPTGSTVVLYGVHMASVDPIRWYSAREATDLLNAEVTEATIKGYCKRGKLDAKKAGPRKRWMIRGASIIRLKQKWDLD